MRLCVQVLLAECEKTVTSQLQQMMKHKKALLFATFLVVACNTKALCAPANVWKIKYSAGPFSGGATTVFLAQNAIKLKTNSDFEVYAKAPDWNATVYNLKARAFCAVPAASYVKGRFFIENEESINDFEPSKAISTENTKMFGFQAKRLSWRRVNLDQRYFRIRDKAVPVLTQLITTTQIPHNKMQIALLSAWIPIPHLSAVPLAFIDKHKDGHIQDRWSAMSIEQVIASQADFRAPSTFTRMSNTNKLLTAQYSSVIEKLLDEQKTIDAMKTRK